jgi:hypothetical protein
VQHGNASHYDVGPGPQRCREDHVDLIVKDPVTKVLRDHHWNEHDDLLVAPRSGLVDEGDDGTDHG